MTEEEKQQAVAYLKLQEDVKQLIIDTIYKELQNYGSPLHSHITTAVLGNYSTDQKIKDVVKKQMEKF